MRLPSVEINQTFARVGADSSPATFEVESQLGEMEVDYNQSHPNQVISDVEIEQQDVIVDIDTTRAWAELGRREFNELVDHLEQEARQSTYESIARIAREGDRLGAIENEEDAIAEIARDNSFDDTEVVMAAIPESPPDINVQPGEVNVESGYDPRDFEVRIGDSSPNISSEASQLEIYLEQEADVDIIAPEIDYRA